MSYILLSNNLHYDGVGVQVNGGVTSADRFKSNMQKNVPNIVDGEIWDGVTDVDVQQDFDLMHHEYCETDAYSISYASLLPLVSNPRVVPQCHHSHI